MMKLLWVVGVVSLVGCVSVVEPVVTTHNLTVEHHRLSRQTYYRSPELTLQNVKAPSSTTLSAYFRMTKTDASDSDTDRYCLYTTTSTIGIGWGLFESAVDADDQQLEVVKSKSDVRRDGVKEEDCIQLSRAYLEQHQQAGLEIKLQASNRDIRFNVAGADVQQFLQSVAAVDTDKRP